MLYPWKEQIEAQLEGKSLSVDEREELKQLRKEVKNLRMEKEILKKVSAFFAKEMKQNLTSSEANQHFLLTVSCCVMQVSTSAYCSWKINDQGS